MSNSLLNAPVSDVGKIQGGCRMQDIKNYFTIQLSRSEQVMDKLYSKNFVRTNLIETMPSPNFSIPVVLSRRAFIFLWKEFDRRGSSLLL